MPTPQFAKNLPRARKRFGQHFLIDRAVINRLIAALNPRDGETILEIGAGRGALTDELVKTPARIIALELDRDLAAHLRETYKSHPNFSLIEADALKADFAAVIAPAERARVVANLPYNVGTPITVRLLEHRALFGELILMLQREVVERMTARPNESARGFLSVIVEGYAEARVLFDVSPTAFTPPPKVWSSVVELRPRTHEGLRGLDEKIFLEVVACGFAQRRKTLANNLRAAPPDLRERIEAAGGANRLLQSAEVEPTRRAETLAFEEWAKIVKAVLS